jgi:hypothetical protein
MTEPCSKPRHYVGDATPADRITCNEQGFMFLTNVAHMGTGYPLPAGEPRSGAVASLRIANYRNVHAGGAIRWQ